MKTLNKEKNKVYYFEKLELLDFVFFLFKKKFQILSQDEIFYIDLGPYFEKVLMPLLSYSKIKFSPLSFKLKDIRDKNGVLIRARIVRHDLFKFESQIRESETFRSITNTLSKQSRAYDFIVKGLTDHGIMNSRSVSRLLFLFEVININNQNIGLHNSLTKC